AEGVRVEFTQDVLPQLCRPDNDGSATKKVNILRKNARKEQDAGSCLIFDMDLFSMWPEVFISPFGIVDMASGDPLTTGRTINYISFPEGASINDFTDQDAIPTANYHHYDVFAAEILRCKQEYPDAEIKIMAGEGTALFPSVGSGTVNEDKFTTWNTSQKTLGLLFDSVAGTVAMHAVKINKARTMVASAYHSTSLSRKRYRSLTGGLRHAFGVALDNFNNLPKPDVIVEMDASDHGLCALDITANATMTYQFSPREFRRIALFKTGEANGFDIH
ncbi:hypothetical protein PHMEG_00018974, partial [Phytophthora megakarya]